MATNKLDLTLYRGDAKTWDVTFTAGGQALDITGVKLIFTVKEDPATADADAALQVEVTSHADPAAGVTELALATADTSALTAGTWYHCDLKMITAGGEPKTLAVGSLAVKEPVTKATS